MNVNLLDSKHPTKDILNNLLLDIFNNSSYDKEKLQERLAKLAGGVAIINVGAAKVLGVSGIPQSILLRADRVIE